MNSSKQQKPKFIPPIRTAASYLKTITESTTVSKYELSPILERELPKPTLERTGSTVINCSPLDSKHDSLWTSIALRQKSLSKVSRDISHLHDLKYSKTEPDLPILSNILPKDLETLRSYLQVVQEPKIKSQRSQICLRNSCISHFGEKLQASNSYRTLDELNMTQDFGGPTSQSEISNLKEWFRYMKFTHLSRIIEEIREVREGKEGKVRVIVTDPGRLEDYEVILKVGVKEFVKQLSALNADRSELLMDIVHHLGMFWTSRFETVQKQYERRNREDKSTINELYEQICELKSHHKEKRRLLKQELGVIRSENLIKSMEIEKLQENIKKLKAERIHRTKIELQRYNEVIKEFTEFRQTTLAKPEDPNNLKLAKALQRKRDALTSLIISKIQLLQNTSLTSSRLTEEHQIEHAMLSISFDDIFVEKSCQIDYSDFCVTRILQVEIPVSSIGVETEEFMDTIIEDAEDFKNDLPEIEKSGQMFSIFVTNENEERVLAFSKKLSNSGVSSPLNTSEMHAGEINKSCSEFPRRRKSVFKMRYSNAIATQTEEKIFADILRMDEEEFYDWILKDRKAHLHNIQRQILNTKTELNKVNKFMSKHRDKLCQSFNFDEGLDISLNSEESFNLSVDEDLEYLRNSGIIGPEIDIPSWRDGYNFGFESRIAGKRVSLSPGRKKKSEETSEEIKVSSEGSSFKSKHKRNPSEELKRKKSTKFQEFRFQTKETKHFGPRQTVKPRFLENFLEGQKIGNSKRVSNTSKKMVLKIISSVYSSAIAKEINEFPPLHIFVYEEFAAKYGQMRVVNKKIMDLMAAVVFYTEERKITTFAKLFGISTKVDIPCYARPKQAFNFFITFNRLLESSHFGIDVGEIKGQVFIPLIRAVECSKELLGRYFEAGKVTQVLNSIEKKSIADPNKINKRLVEHEGLMETLLEVYNDYNTMIEKALIELLNPFRFLEYPKKIHKFDFFIVLRYFYPEKFQTGSLNNPLEYFEQQLDHPRSSNLISMNKVIDLCFQNKLLYPEDTKEKVTEILGNKRNETLNVRFREEMFRYRIDFSKIVENREKFELDSDFIANWEKKIVMILEEPDDVPDKMKIFWRIMACEVNRLVSLC